MKTYYTIEKVLFNAISPTNIPYCLGMLIRGPKGALYFVDVFNCEVIIRLVTGKQMIEKATDSVMRGTGKMLNKYTAVNIKYQGEVDLNNQIVEMYKCHILSRKTGVPPSGRHPGGRPVRCGPSGGSGHPYPVRHGGTGRRVPYPRGTGGSGIPV